jgi:hypothetical protein
VEFHPGAASVDAALALGVTILLTSVAEWRRRRRQQPWQITLRDLAYVVVLLAGFFAYIASLYRSSHEQRRAVATLDAISASSPRDIPFNDGTSSTILFPMVIPSWEPQCSWFWETIACSELAPMKAVSLHVTLVSAWPERTADALAKLPYLRVLQIGPGGPLPDSVFRQIGKLKLLEELEFNLIPLTDGQLAYLSELRQLRRLTLGSNGITDAGLEHLRHLPQLEVLNLFNNPVTDAGSQALQQALPNLLILDD